MYPHHPPHHHRHLPIRRSSHHRHRPVHGTYPFSRLYLDRSTRSRLGKHVGPCLEEEVTTGEHRCFSVSDALSLSLSLSLSLFLSFFLFSPSPLISTSSPSSLDPPFSSWLAKGSTILAIWISINKDGRTSCPTPHPPSELWTNKTNRASVKSHGRIQYQIQYHHLHCHHQINISQSNLPTYLPTYLPNLSIYLYIYDTWNMYRSPQDPSRLVIKRIVGLEGDLIPTTTQPPSSSSFPPSTTTTTTATTPPPPRIPPGHVWVQGDDPPHSLDSHVYGPGCHCFYILVPSPPPSLWSIFPPCQFWIFLSAMILDP